MTENTIGEHLNALRKRAGLSLSQVAKAAGYSGASSVQVYFNSDYDPVALNTEVGLRLQKALVGKGTPPILPSEIFYMPRGLPEGFEAFPGLPATEVSKPLEQTPTLRGQPKDVPVYGTALAVDFVIGDDGKDLSIEQTSFDMGEIIAHVRRPTGIDQSKNVYALFVAGSSMEPRYRAGDPVFVDPKRPPAIGDDVVVQLSRPIGDDQEIAVGLIKVLTRRTASALELEQYNPPLRFAVGMESVAAVHRIIPWREAFGI